MDFIAENYKTRKELDDVVRSTVGDNAGTNRITHKIICSSEDMKRLRLSVFSVVFGVPCEIKQDK